MLAVSVLGIYIAGLTAPYLLPRLRAAGPWLYSLVPAGICVGLGTGYIGSSCSIPWIEPLGLAFTFSATGLSRLFALLITGIGTVVTLYSGGYFEKDRRRGRWFSFLFLFMASMLGLVLSDNVFSLFIFWELTSITSFLLIGFDHEKPEARDAALQSLVVTAGGGLCLLAGLVLLSLVTGNINLSEMAASAVAPSPLLSWAAALILIGAATKSAQVPVQFWLPNAMTAPTPASAFLHSSTMVKAGVFLLYRLHPAFGELAWWGPALMVMGGLTALAGGWMAVRQHTLKPLLAWSTVSSLGILVLLIGVGTPESLFAAALFLFAHALYKATLFLVAGIVDHETGERDTRKLGGLRVDMPITAITATLAGLSMAGLPLTAGFVAKEVVYETLVHTPTYGWLAAGVILLAGASFVLVAWAVSVKPFHGRLVATPLHPHDPGAPMFLGPIALAIAGITGGLVPSALLEKAASACVPGGYHGAHLAPWHGFNLPLVLSAVTIALGALAVWIRTRNGNAIPVTGARCQWGTERLYLMGMSGLERRCAAFSSAAQHGYLRLYLFTVLLGVMALVWPLLYRHAAPLGGMLVAWAGRGIQETRWHEWALLLTMVMAIGATVHARTRLGAVTALGVVGYVIAMIFVLFGAPDLAMTQFVIETLTVILIALTFSHLPPFRDLSPTWVRLRDLAFAVMGGAAMTVLTLVALGARRQESVAGYYLAHSYDLAHGKNVVNVILVDFRGIDTLGEITVLAIAALGAFALLRLSSDPNRKDTT